MVKTAKKLKQGSGQGKARLCESNGKVIGRETLGGEEGRKDGKSLNESPLLLPVPLQSVLFQHCNKLHLMQSMNQPKITWTGVFFLLYWAQRGACHHLHVSLYQPPPLAKQCLRSVSLSRAQKLLYYSSPQISSYVSVFRSSLCPVWLSSLLYTVLPSLASAANSCKLASPWKDKETVKSIKLCNPEQDALHPVS